MPPPELHRATLSNGLRVLIVPDPATPVVGVAVHVDVGFRSEPEGRTGFAHLFEHLMFQGSESLEKLAHFRHVQSSGGVFNGSTHQDYTDYFEVLPAAALERALFLEADRLRAPTLSVENLRNQVDVVKEEIRLNVLNRPYGGFPWILLPPVLYDTFPNAHNGYGDFSELEQASLDDAASFFDTYYAPGNAQVTVAGYLDVDETLRAGREALRRHPRPPDAHPPLVRRTTTRHRAAPGRARRARPAARAGRRLPAARPGRRPRRLPRPRAAGLRARRRRGRPAAAPPRARRRPGHRHLRGRGPDGRRSTRATPTRSRSPRCTPRPSTPTGCWPRVDEELDKLAAEGPSDEELAPPGRALVGRRSTRRTTG